MFRNVYSIGIMIFIAIMIAFFTTNIFFRDINYYRNTITINAFLLPLIFAIGAYISVTTYSRLKKKLSFKEAYGRAFIPMFIGGFLSISIIFFYINYIDRSTKELLNHQYIESFKVSLDEEYEKSKNVFKPGSEDMKDVEKKYMEGKQRIMEKEKRNEDMFSFKYFAYVFAGYSAFFLLLSLFFGSFFRTRSYE